MVISSKSAHTPILTLTAWTISTTEKRLSDLDHFGPGDFGRLLVISDGDFGRCAVKSYGDFGRCAVNSDAAVNSDGAFGLCAVNSDA